MIQKLQETQKLQAGMYKSLERVQSSNKKDLINQSIQSLFPKDYNDSASKIRPTIVKRPHSATTRFVKL